MNRSISWFNYKIGEWELLSESPVDYRNYIPQSIAAQGMYDCYVALGLKPAEAAINVLGKSVGEDAPFEVKR